ncbi:hypothetical protein [Streptomyces sp. TN58]|uniref:hypothetical protein n=1 Tax=Streptomyces sp. TN58 TaxID=234612 RepID=UPI0009507AB9|nr:hypothetical protein [Streptomyces sp. TN58]APU43201.1 hypothetical protein BSL84_28965 [Streptomyces sp. TN58]
MTDSPGHAPDGVSDAELARRWLAEDGVTQTGPDTWYDAEPPARVLTTRDVCDHLGCLAFTDDSLDVPGRLRVALGLMDLLGWHPLVTHQIHSAHLGPQGPLPAELLWGGYRRRLESEREHEAITCSLWFDWFEYAPTAAEAFAEVLGDDRERLLPGAPEPLLRRARRVLEHSGPVPWGDKVATLRAAARVPALHHAVFRAVLRGHHDSYGSVDPAQGLDLLDLLDRLAPAPTTERLQALRDALAAVSRPEGVGPGSAGAVRGGGGGG